LGLNKLNLNPEISDSLLFIFIYSNLEEDKAQIFSDNKGKSGIYCFINKINGSLYVGSAVDLRKRLRDYLSKSNLKCQILRSRSIIYRSLLKNGYENFILEILEYCEAEQCVEREDYYRKLLKPDYNICKKAGPSFGGGESEATRAIKSAPKSVLCMQHKKNAIFAQPNRQIIEVFDIETNTTTSYDSINAAAKGLGCCRGPIQYQLKALNPKPYKGRYVF
jgi:hypothetical protein